MTLARQIRPIGTAALSVSGSEVFAVGAGETWQLFSLQVTGLYAPFGTVSMAIVPATGTARTLLDRAAIRAGVAVPVMIGDHALMSGDSIRMQASGTDRATVIAAYDSVAASGSTLKRFMVPVTSTSGDVATVPANRRWRVLGLQATGLHAPNVTLTLTAHPAGGSAVDLLRAARIDDARVLPLMTGSWVLEAGDRLSAALAADAELGSNAGAVIYMTVDEEDA